MKFQNTQEIKVSLVEGHSRLILGFIFEAAITILRFAGDTVWYPVAL
jgi:hypothetical protein